MDCLNPDSKTRCVYTFVYIYTVYTYSQYGDVSINGECHIYFFVSRFNSVNSLPIVFKV